MKQHTLFSNPLTRRKVSQEQHEEKEKHLSRLDTILDRNENVLFKTKTIFLMDFFRDTIIIDMTKINIINKTFFATEHVTSIPLKSVADIFLQTSLFAGSLTIQYMPHSANPGMLSPVDAKIHNLWRTDAVIAKNIIRGMIIANAEKIDLTHIAKQDLRPMMERLGGTQTHV